MGNSCICSFSSILLTICRILNLVDELMLKAIAFLFSQNNCKLPTKLYSDPFSAIVQVGCHLEFWVYLDSEWWLEQGNHEPIASWPSEHPSTSWRWWRIQFVSPASMNSRQKRCQQTCDRLFLHSTKPVALLGKTLLMQLPYTPSSPWWSVWSIWSLDLLLASLKAWVFKARDMIACMPNPAAGEVC